MNWKFHFSRSTNPWENLALENIWLLEPMENPIFYGYFNEPCAVIGKNQNLFQELNLPYLYDNQIPMVRRTSGGGTVYHDLGCLNLSFITPHRTDWVGKWDFFFEPLIHFLNSNGLKAFTNPRNSLMIGDKKVGGSAQKVSRGRMISHCSLLFHTNLLALEKSLLVSNTNMESSATPSVRAKVMNLEETHLFPENSEAIFLKIKSIYEQFWGEFEPLLLPNISQAWDEKTNELRGNDWRFGRNPSFKLVLESGLILQSNGNSIIHQIWNQDQFWEVDYSPFSTPDLSKIPSNFHSEIREVLNNWRIHLELGKS